MANKKIIKNKTVKKEANKIVKKEEKRVGNGFGIAGFVLGAIPLLVLIIYRLNNPLMYLSLESASFWLLSIIFSILGIVFSSIQIKKKKTTLAVTGLILSILALVWIILINFTN
jgi:hypothetical protein